MAWWPMPVCARLTYLRFLFLRRSASSALQNSLWVKSWCLPATLYLGSRSALSMISFWRLPAEDLVRASSKQLTPLLVSLLLAKFSTCKGNFHPLSSIKTAAKSSTHLSFKLFYYSVSSSKLFDSLNMVSSTFHVAWLSPISFCVRFNEIRFWQLLVPSITKLKASTVNALSVRLRC